MEGQKAGYAAFGDCFVNYSGRFYTRLWPGSLTVFDHDSCNLSFGSGLVGNLNTGEWLILSKIDGHRSVKEIAAATRLSAFDAAKILYGLVATGLIRLRPSPSAVTPGPAVARSAAPAKPAAATKPAPAPRPAPAVSTAAAAPPVAPPPPPPALAARAAPAASTEGAAQIARLNRVREVCNGLLGPAGESVVNKHYQKARSDLERGAGSEAVEEAIHQIARASSILKGPSTTEALLEQLKAIK